MGHPSNLLALFLDYTAVNFMLEGKEGLLVGGGGVFCVLVLVWESFWFFFFFNPTELCSLRPPCCVFLCGNVLSVGVLLAH